MKVQIVCQYCDFKWIQAIYSPDNVDQKCLKCKDTNLVVKDLSKVQLDTYIGCPAFPEEKEEDFPLVDDTGFPFYYRGD